MRRAHLLLLMPLFDFSEAAHQEAPWIPAEPTANARRLRAELERRRFQALASEWWHFDWQDWPALPVVR
jgi:D-alanyl-D-alanine dipeptidase